MFTAVSSPRTCRHKMIFLVCHRGDLESSATKVLCTFSKVTGCGTASHGLDCRRQRPSVSVQRIWYFTKSFFGAMNGRTWQACPYSTIFPLGCRGDLWSSAISTIPCHVVDGLFERWAFGRKRLRTLSRGRFFIVKPPSFQTIYRIVWKFTL